MSLYDSDLTWSRDQGKQSRQEESGWCELEQTLTAEGGSAIDCSSPSLTDHEVSLED